MDAAPEWMGDDFLMDAIKLPMGSVRKLWHYCTQCVPCHKPWKVTEATAMSSSTMPSKT